MIHKWGTLTVKEKLNFLICIKTHIESNIYTTMMNFKRKTLSEILSLKNDFLRHILPHIIYNVQR